MFQLIGERKECRLMRIYQVIPVKKLFGERRTVGGRDAWPRCVAEMRGEMSGRDNWPKSQIRKIPHQVERNNHAERCERCERCHSAGRRGMTSSAGLGEPTGEHSIMATSAFNGQRLMLSMQIFTSSNRYKGPGYPGCRYLSQLKQIYPAKHKRHCLTILKPKSHTSTSKRSITITSQCLKTTD